MHSLDDGVSILKRGIVTMPASIHRTTAQYSLPSNWHCPSELHPINPRSSVYPSSWMLKGSIRHPSLNSGEDPFPQNHLTISQTPSGPSILMVYYTLRHSMFWTLAISDYMFSSTHTTIPLQVILVRQRPSSSPYANTIGLDFQSMSRTTANHAPLVPMPNLCATSPTDSQATSNSWEALGIPYLWIHREAPSIFRLYLDSSLLIISQSSHSSSRLMIPLHHHNLHNSSFYMSFPSMVVPSHILPIMVQNLFPTSSGPSELCWTWSSLHFWISSWRWWTNRMN